MSQYWCAVGADAITYPQLLADYNAERMRRFDIPDQRDVPTPAPYHLWQYLSNHLCRQFEIPGHRLAAGGIVDVAGYWIDGPQPIDPATTQAICATHRAIATSVQSFNIQQSIVMYALAHAWQCLGCGAWFTGQPYDNTTAMFINHLNTDRQCRQWYVQSMNGQMHEFPVTADWPEHQIDLEPDDVFGMDADEEHDEEDEEHWDEEPEDNDGDAPHFVLNQEAHDAIFGTPLQAHRITIGQTEAEITNHFRDDIRPPVTTNDGRYLRWNELNARYEEARRPATTMHDVFGG